MLLMRPEIRRKSYVELWFCNVCLCFHVIYYIILILVNVAKNMRKKLEDFSKKITRWIGSPQSIIVHTIFFIGMLSLRLFGISSEDVLLILTTVVSLEAIYLSIFIQMTVNQHAAELEEVSEDIEEIQKDVDEIQEDVEDIQEEIIDEDDSETSIPQ